MRPTSPLARMFGPSPFKSLQKHMRAVLACAHQVPDLFEALFRGSQEDVAVLKDAIFETEQRADEIKNELRNHLPKSFFLPVDRRDLLDVLQMQDSIADSAQDIAGLFVQRPMQLPTSMHAPFLCMVRRCIDACDQAASIIERLDELKETGFRGRQMVQVEEMVQELNKIEDDTDEQELLITRALFQHEDDMSPVSVMMWYQVIQWVGDLADYAEKVGDRLRLLIAR